MSETKYGVTISPQMPENTRLLGSSGLSLTRPERGDFDLVLDPVGVSVPDVGIQVIPCLENVPGLPPNLDLEVEVIAAIRQSFGAGADVRYACIAGSGRIGVWMSPPADQDVINARLEGLASLDLVKGNELYGIFINSSFIRKGREGVPPPSQGSLHFTAMKILFRAPDKIITRVEGYDERPWPDINFTLDLIDIVTASGGQIQVQSTDDLDVDRSWQHYLLGAIIGAAGFLHPALWFIGGVPFLLQELAIRGQRPPPQNGGAGAAAASLLPGSIFLRGGSKVVAMYDRAEVSEGGLFAGGSLTVLDREPTCQINGPEGIAVGPDDDGALGEFHVRRGDLRAPLTIAWSADGLVANADKVNTQIGFSIPVGQQVINRKVQVRVTDADGLFAEDEITVRLRRVTHDPSLPPVCKVKPWLPQCNP
ncbi:MAG: hypothetical protein ABIV13_04780 [Fimbriimonadales bacterium]